MGEKNNNFPLKGVRKIVAFLFEATERVRESASPATPRSHCERPPSCVPGREAAHRDEGPGMPVSARGICRAEHSAFLLLLNMFLVHKGLKGHFTMWLTCIASLFHPIVESTQQSRSNRRTHRDAVFAALRTQQTEDRTREGWRAGGRREAGHLRLRSTGICSSHTSCCSRQRPAARLAGNAVTSERLLGGERS